LNRQKPKATVHTQLRAMNSDHPSRKSAMVLRRGSSSPRTGGTRMNASTAAATPNVAASTAIPQPGPIVATIRPPNTAPRISAAFTERRLIAFAGCSRSAGTVWGTSAELAGTANAAAAPLIADRHISSATLAVPVSTTVATAALSHHRGEARANEHQLPWHTVRDHTAEEQQQHVCQRPSSHNQTEVGRGAGQVEHREREGDRSESVAGHAHRTGR
jgi:hypothetical protein